ncbi:MAG: hypothetical protein OXH14_05980, partial [Alphaproteobacteria bacterium]|nr:hypothetical protein [Alphaproteobacteria bacterium]
MSVLWIGGFRFAAGLDWDRGLVSGSAARRIARQRGRPLSVNVSGQSGFGEDVEGAEGTKPLAGALAMLLRGREDAKNWIAFVEEDGDAGRERRLAVVRCYGGLLLSDDVFVDLPEALEALGDAAVEDDVLVVATGALSERFKDELRAKADAIVEGAGIVKAADGMDALEAVPTSGWTRKRLARVAALVAVVTASWWGWTNQDRLLLWAGFAEEEQERRKVKVVVDTDRFLAYCRDELARRELWLAGFERVGVTCHSSFERVKETGAPKKLKTRPVLEVRWELRGDLPARVYGRLAEQLMESWYWAGVTDEGKVVAASPLPQVLAEAAGVKRPKANAFRAQMDATFPLRGVAVEYHWKKKREVILKTRRTLADGRGRPGASVVPYGRGWRAAVRGRREDVLLFRGRNLRSGRGDSDLPGGLRGRGDRQARADG